MSDSRNEFEDEKLDFLIRLISRTRIESQIYKSITCLKNICYEWRVILKLYNKEVPQHNDASLTWDIFNVLDYVVSEYP